MFGIISKKRLVNEAIKIYLEEDTSKARSADNLMYRMGNANALNGICTRLGVDLTKYIKEAKRSRGVANDG